MKRMLLMLVAVVMLTLVTNSAEAGGWKIGPPQMSGTSRTQRYFGASNFRNYNPINGTYGRGYSPSIGDYIPGYGTYGVNYFGTYGRGYGF